LLPILQNQSAPQPHVQLEHWKGHVDGVDLSHFASEGLVEFKSTNFCTVRGPAFHRRQISCGYEIKVLEPGECPQYGFCTSAFGRNDRETGHGCGDDSHSWAWDGVRHQFWNNGCQNFPQISWACGDVLTLECDFSCNMTRISKNGINMLEYAFSPDIEILYPAITGQGDKVEVNFGSKPFQFFKSLSVDISNKFLITFKQDCGGPESSFVASMRIILGNLLFKYLIQDGQLSIHPAILCNVDHMKLLCFSLWFNGNEDLQDATAKFVKKHFNLPYEYSLSACQSLVSSFMRGIENPLIAFVKTGERFPKSDIIYLDDCKRVSAVHSMLFGIAQTIFDKLFDGTSYDASLSFLTRHVKVTEETMLQMSAVFGSLPGLADVLSLFEAHLLSKACLHSEFYNSHKENSFELLCKRLVPHMDNVGVVSVLRHELDQMEDNTRRKLLSRCVLLFLMKIAVVLRLKPDLYATVTPSDAHSRSAPSKSAVDISEHSALKVGDRVRRGADWKWSDQDRNGVGVVSENLDSDGWIGVDWDHGSSNKYLIF
jgi:hypothetical protein